MALTTSRVWSTFVVFYDAVFDGVGLNEPAGKLVKQVVSALFATVL